MTPAYFAGFFDGEGCVFLQTTGGLEVRISQVDRRPLDLLFSEFGGKVLPQSGYGRSKDYFNWRIMRWEEGVRFLRAIRPHLIVKAEQVDLVLAYYDRRKQADPGAFQHGCRMTVAEHAERTSLRHQLSVMKGNRSRTKSTCQALAARRVAA